MKFYFTPTTNGQCWAYFLDRRNYYRPVMLGKIDKGCGGYTGRRFYTDGRITLGTGRWVVARRFRNDVAECLIEKWIEENEGYEELPYLDYLPTCIPGCVPFEVEGGEE